jgi:hypothetical protein
LTALVLGLKLLPINYIPKILSFIELVLIAKYTAAVSTLSFCLI